MPLPPAALAHGAGPQALLGAQPPDAPFTDDVACSLEIVSQQAVADLGVVAIGVDERIGQVGVVEVALTDGLSTQA